MTSEGLGDMFEGDSAADGERGHTDNFDHRGVLGSSGLSSDISGHPGIKTYAYFDFPPEISSYLPSIYLMNNSLLDIAARLVEIPNNPTRSMDWIPTNIVPCFLISFCCVDYLNTC